MDTLNLGAWASSEANPNRRLTRQAIHLLLRSIGGSPELSSAMTLKGGILLALRYHSSRFTTDIDFSTPKRLPEFDLPQFLEAMGDALDTVSVDNEYGIALRLQSHKINPSNQVSPAFPTLALTIGIAQNANPRQLAKLKLAQASNVVQVDFSFNEWHSAFEITGIDGGEMQIYALNDLIAEKIRAVLQQPIRNRARYQDVYDLHLLLTANQFDAAQLAAILAKVKSACEARGIFPEANSLESAEIRALSVKGYQSELSDLVSGDVPEFDVAFSKLLSFYRCLPW